MKQVIKWRLKKIVLFVICAGFLAMVFLPGPGHASSVTSDGTAFIDWSAASFSITTAAGAPVATSWSYQSSFSGTYVTLNEGFTDPGSSDAFETPIPPATSTAWVTTKFGASLAAGSNSVTGSAATGPSDSGAVDPLTLLPKANQISASANIALNGHGNASVPVAQATLFGIFSIAADGTLTVTVPYTLNQSLVSTSPTGKADSLISVGLSLFDDATSALLASTPDATFFNSISGVNSFTLPVADQSGTLSLIFPLVALDQSKAPISYDFEAQATAIGSAAVPEAGTLLLFGTGLVGLATTVRKRFKKEV